MEISRAYDNIIYRTTINIYTLSKDKESIELYGLNIKDPEHLWFFNTARMASSVFTKPITIDANVFVRFRLWFKYRKRMNWIKHTPHGSSGKNIGEILEFMRPSAIEETEDENFKYTDIEKYFEEIHY